MESDFVTISLVTTTSVRMGDSNPWAESGRDISDPTAYKVFSANCVFSKWGILSRWGTLFLFKPNYSIARMDYFYFCFGFLFICFVLLFNWVISSRNSFLELIKYNFRKGNVRCLQKKNLPDGFEFSIAWILQKSRPSGVGLWLSETGFPSCFLRSPCNLKPTPPLAFSEAPSECGVLW